MVYNKKISNVNLNPVQEKPKPQEKLTRRQIKKEKKLAEEKLEINKMCVFLEKKYKNNIKYSCGHCLKKAYESELIDQQGCVTDEELIESSGGKLLHM